MALLIKEVSERWPGTRILCLTHVQELIEQDHAELLDAWPEAPAGIYSAGLGRKDHKAPILFAGIQSIEKTANLLSPPPEIVLVDECFSGETEISTPEGLKRIDNMRCGDVVYNSAGIGMVEAVSIKETENIFIVRLSNEKVIRCTGSHPFYTEQGWVEARNLERGQGLFCLEKMQAMREGFLPLGCYRRRKDSAYIQRGFMGKARMLRSILCKKIKKSNEKRSIERKNVSFIKKNRTPAKDTRREWMFDCPSNFSIINTFGRLENRTCNQNKSAKERPHVSPLLQIGLGKRKAQNRDRTRREYTLWKKYFAGQKERRFIENVWVESVSIEKRTGNESVYNLQVSGSPTYYANGVLVHNCHLIPRNEQTRYMRTLKILAVMYPALRVVGFTATPYRMDSGWLHKGDDAMFQDIIYSVEPQYLIDQGFLSPVFARAGAVKIDTDGVHKRGGEFISGELEKAAMAGDTTAVAVADFIERGKDRKKWLVFVTGLAHAEQVYQAVINEGITADVVTGTTPKAQRKKIVEEFKCGQIKCLINIDVLTTGFNCRDLDMIVMLRPTGSPSLYVQMVGRGMRVAAGKTDCLLLDFSANVVRHGPIDAVDPEAPSKGEGVAPAKECPSCQAIIAAGFRICPVCGHEFPAPEPKIAPRPVEAPVLKSQILPQEYEVTGCRYCRHQKQGKKDSIRVEYTCGFLTFKEWVFPDAGTPQLAFYYGKFMSAAGVEYKDWPRTVEAFLSAPPRSPSRIWVTQEGKFDRVTRKEYGDGAPVVMVDGPSIKQRYDMVAEQQYDDVVPF